MVVQDRMERVGRKKKDRLKLRGDMYWMNKLCGCWTPIRDTKQRKRGKRTRKWNRLLMETKVDI
jgi:hypothetical protein